MFARIRWQLTAWYMLALATIMTLVGLGFYFAARNVLLGEQDKELRLAADFAVRTMVPSLREERSSSVRGDGDEDDDRPGGSSDNDGDEKEKDGKKGDKASPDREDDNGDEPPEGERLTLSLVWTFAGTADGWSTSTAPAWVTAFPHQPSLQRALRDGTAFFTTVADQGEVIRLYTLPVREGPRVTAVVQTGKPITAILGNLHQLLVILMLAGAGGLTLAAVGGLFLANRALVPIRLAFRRQREFVADASHELRTPLAVLRASAEVLDRELRGGAPEVAGRPAVHETLDNLLSETERMGRLVSDLLTLARADSGDLELDLKPMDAAEVAGSAARKAGVLAREKGVEFSASLPGALPMEGDPARLEQLLLILLDNAVKYTDAGGRVTLRAAARGNRVEFQVSDTGIGIPPAELPRIFDRFYRVDKARSRQQGGTGLGLAIARWIVDAHGGTIQVESEPGRGTTFTVSLPLHARGPAPSSARGASSLINLKDC